MRNNYLLGLGGALLATTSLSGAASAATIYVQSNANGVTNVQGGEFTTTSVARSIGAQLFGSGGLTATSTIGVMSIAVKFTNTYGGSLKPNLFMSISGATFSTTSLGGQSNTYVKLLDDQGTGGGTIATTFAGNSAACTVGVLSTQIQIQGCAAGNNLAAATVGGANASFAIAGMALSGIIFTAATGLGTVGSSITLSGSVVDGTNAQNVFESITPAAVVTSVNNVTVAVFTGTASVNQGTGTVPFVTVSQTLGGPGAGTSTGLTVELAAITITGTGAVGQDLTTGLTAANAVGGLGLVVTSPVLSDPAISNVRFVSVANATVATATTLAGTATFAATTLTQATIYGGSAGNSTSYVQVEYNGTASITGGAASTAGTVGTFAVATANGTAVPAFTGGTSAVSRAGFSTQINSVLASNNVAATSYIRIVNGGSAAGAATITVYDGSLGTKLGSAYTTASIPANGTLQVSAANIETGAGFTPTIGQTYTLSIAGPLSGYVQHITLNPGGVFTDFSGRRVVTLPTNAD